MIRAATYLSEGTMRHVRLGALAATALLGILHFDFATAALTPPPPRMTESYDAIAALEPFLGTWRSEQEIPGGNTIEHYRRVAKGPGDVIYLTLGQGPNQVEFINVLVFDVHEQQLKLFLPGYRSLGNQGDSAALAPVVSSAPNMLQWTSQEALSTDEVIRTTIRIEGGAWHETIENLHPSGGVKQTRVQEFRRIGDARISF